MKLSPTEQEYLQRRTRYIIKRLKIHVEADRNLKNYHANNPGMVSKEKFEAMERVLEIRYATLAGLEQLLDDFEVGVHGTYRMQRDSGIYANNYHQARKLQSTYMTILP